MTDTQPRILWSLGHVGPGDTARTEAILDALEGASVQLQGCGPLRRELDPHGRPVGSLLPLRHGTSALARALLAPWNLLILLVDVSISTARILATRPHLVVVDEEYSAVLPALLLGCRQVSVDRGASASDVAAVVEAELRAAVAPPVTRQPIDGRPIAAVTAVALACGLFTDVVMHVTGLVKIEQANALRLAEHALIRDGQIVIATSAPDYAEATYHWFYHPILAISPKLADVAVALNVVHYVGVAALGWVVARILGRPAGMLAAGMLIAAPVSPILSKHVISTALVPLTMALYTAHHLAASRGDRVHLGASLALLALLVQLNVGHAVLLLPWLYAAWRTGQRPPAWSVVLAAVCSIPTVVRLGWLMTSGRIAGVGVWLDLGGVYVTGWDWVRRMILVEHRMHEMFPNLYLLFLIAILAAGTAWRHRDHLPRGLVPLLATAIPLYACNAEASVIWQTPFFVLVAWAALWSVSTRRVALLHVALGGLAWGTAVAIGPPPDSFFALSSLSVRHHVLDVLTDELGMGQAEFETLTLRHPIGENGVNALMPGAGYLVDRVRPPLPAGGDRCLMVSDPGTAAPEGVTLLQEITRDGLVYRAWRDPAGCTGSPRVPTDPVLVWDLARGEAIEVRP